MLLKMFSHNHVEDHWSSPPPSHATALFSLLAYTNLFSKMDWEHTKTSTYICDVTTVSPLIQLLEQIAQQYELKAFSNIQIKIQPKTSESY
jgi:hypothetical protein